MTLLIIIIVDAAACVALVGGVAGGIISGASYGATKAVQAIAAKSSAAAAVTCVAVGVVGAIVAAPVVAVVAVGAVVGAVGLGASAAISTSITDGEVDWQAVLDCVGVGAVAGGIISGASYGATKAVQAIAAKSSAVSGSQKVASGKGYKSFEAFKNANGTAGKDQAWHHIVEQNSNNITKFGAENIHNTGNLVKIPSGYQGSLHSKITGLYNSINKSITGNTTQTVRQWLSAQSFDAQYKFGVEKLLEFAKELGITVILP